MQARRIHAHISLRAALTQGSEPQSATAGDTLVGALYHQPIQRQGDGERHSRRDVHHLRIPGVNTNIVSDVSGECCIQCSHSALSSNIDQRSVLLDDGGTRPPLQHLHTRCFAGEQSSGSDGTCKVIQADLLEVRGQVQRGSCTYITWKEIKMQIVQAKYTRTCMYAHAHSRTMIEALGLANSYKQVHCSESYHDKGDKIQISKTMCIAMQLILPPFLASDQSTNATIISCRMSY